MVAPGCGISSLEQPVWLHVCLLGSEDGTFQVGFIFSRLKLFLNLCFKYFFMDFGGGLYYGFFHFVSHLGVVVWTTERRDRN